MNDKDAMIAAIIREPAEDAPRLAFADLLDEAGEAERAEFIRVQIELAGLNPSREDHDWDLYARAAGIKYKCLATCEKCSRERLQTREREILGARPGWFPESMIPCFSGDGRISVGGKPNGFGPPIFFRFSRGFVSEVRAPLSVLMAHLPAIVRAHPVARVEVTDKNPIGNPNDPSSDGWVRESSVDEVRDMTDVIPDELYDRLTGGFEWRVHVQWTRYRTEAEARAALSDALLAWARAARISRRTPAHRGNLP